MAEQGKGKVRGFGSQSDGMEGRSGSLLVCTLQQVGSG
jgi:hypothetical protein